MDMTEEERQQQIKDAKAMIAAIRKKAKTTYAGHSEYRLHIIAQWQKLLKKLEKAHATVSGIHDSKE